jgi:hypothetical protein
MATWYVVSLVSLPNMILNFCVKTAVSLAMSNGILVAIYCKSEEFQYIRALIDSVLAKFWENNKGEMR